MQTTVPDKTLSTESSIQLTGHPDWEIVSNAIVRTENVSSLDDLLYQALDLWIQQLSPELRWQIAIDLYTSEEVSLGRAAEISGLNYIVFMEKLRCEGIQLITAESTTESQIDMRKSLIHAGFNFTHS